MKRDSSSWEGDFKHDLKNLILQLDGALKLLNSSSETERQEIRDEILESVSSFLQKQGD